MSIYKIDKFDSLVLFMDHFLHTHSIVGNEFNHSAPYLCFTPGYIMRIFNRFFKIKANEMANIDFNLIDDANILLYLKKYDIINNDTNILNIISWFEDSTKESETFMSSLHKNVCHHKFIEQISEINIKIGEMSASSFLVIIKAKKNYEKAKRIFIIEEIIK